MASDHFVGRCRRREAIFIRHLIEVEGGELFEKAVDPTLILVMSPPETFYRSKAVGSLSGYQPRVFTISPPRVERVIEKRLEFASAKLKGTGKLDSFPSGLKVQSASLETYLRVLVRSFCANEDLGEFIDSIAGGNVR